MESILDQIESIKDRFKTKRIYDKTTRWKLTDEEIEGIIYTLKCNHLDGEYVITDEIIVELKNGCAYIKDNFYD